MTINSTQIKAQFDGDQVVASMQGWAQELGFSQIGVAGVDLSSAEPGLLAWLSQGFHGGMGYMERHGLKRARPAELLPGTVSVITARMDYLPRTTPHTTLHTTPYTGLDIGSGSTPDTTPGMDTDAHDWRALEWAAHAQPGAAVVSMYARGRDYHKVLRQRLQNLAQRLHSLLGPVGARVFTDSAPVLEVELAARSGIGWRGKHTLLLHREAGSLFFLGEIFVDVALPVSPPVDAHCGSCSACMAVCPTQAIVAPYQLDARRCISYLTIEHDGPIPLAMRALLGKRIYGCDDCQLACPWNKFAQRSTLPDFDPCAGLHGVQLADLLDWSAEQFLHHTEGSAIRRIGHVRWLRNVALAMGNALRTDTLSQAQRDRMRGALQRRSEHPEPWLREQVLWSLLAQDPQGE